MARYLALFQVFPEQLRRQIDLAGNAINFIVHVGLSYLDSLGFASLKNQLFVEQVIQNDCTETLDTGVGDLVSRNRLTIDNRYNHRIFSNGLAGARAAPVAGAWPALAAGLFCVMFLSGC